MRTRTSSSAARIWRVASTPSSNGMLTSISTTCGCSRRASSTASSPSPARPTTSMRSSPARIASSASANRRWSSAISTRRRFGFGIRSILPCYGRPMEEDDPRARIQKLLVTGDNRLKQGVDPAKARESWTQALALDQGAAALLAARLPGERERLRPALAGLRRVDALLQPVVAGDEELLDPLADIRFHTATVTGQDWHMPLPRSKPVHVLIADDHRLFAEALEAILATDDRVEVVGRASDGGEAVELALRLRPDVVLMDVSMPVLDGFEATREIRAGGSDVSVLMLTGSNSRADVDRSRAAGASGYVTKDRIASELVEAIVEVARRRLR